MPGQRALNRLASGLSARARQLLPERRLRAFNCNVGPGLRPGIVKQLEGLQSEIGFAGKRVLEIGGDLEGKVARACVTLGARHVISINHDEGFQPRDEACVSFRRMDAAALEFPAGHFDLVVGFAVLEHIRGLGVVLDGIHRVTKPGGLVYLQGGPLWYSRKGHHLVVVAPSGRHYRFDGRNGSSNPIADWEHLSMAPGELRSCLLGRRCPGADADTIVEFVFGSPLINRYSVAHLKSCFAASRLTVHRCDEKMNSSRKVEPAAAIGRRHRLPAAELRTNSISFLAGR